MSPNNRFQFANLLDKHVYDPGVLTGQDITYLADITGAFATEKGGLKVFSPNDPTKLHPAMGDMISANYQILNLVKHHVDISGGLSKTLTVLTEDTHDPGHPSWASTYKHSDGMMFQTITRADLEGWNGSEIATSAFSLDDFERLLDLSEIMRVYTMEHGRAGTPDGRLIPVLANHSATKTIVAKGYARSPRAGMVPEQFALGRYDTGESTGVIESWAAQGYKRMFVSGLCGNICVAEQAIATRELSDMEVVFLVDAQLPLPIPASPFETTAAELDELGLDKSYWLGINPDSTEPLTLEELQGARMVAAGVKFSTVALLSHNMHPLRI